MFFSIARDIKQRLSDTDTKQEVKFYCVVIIEELSTNWLFSGIVLGSTGGYSHVDLHLTTLFNYLNYPAFTLLLHIYGMVKRGVFGIRHQSSLAGPLTYIT